MKTIQVSAVLLVAVSASAAAQKPPAPNARVIQALPSKYMEPACDLKAGHFKVSSGATYLKTGIETEIPENQARALDDGKRVITEAIRQNGQGKNPAAWYFLGRVYLQQGDLVGADSAFAKAQAGAPACAKDIENYRRMVWAPLVNAGSKFYDGKKADSAIALYHLANQIYHASPVPDYQIGSLMSERSQPDSAVVYFGRAVQIARNSTDTTEVKIRNRSAFNQGVLYLNAQKFREAMPAFERYLQWVPNDYEAKKGLAAAYRGAGQTDKAAAIEKELVNAPAASGAGPGAGPGAGGAGAQDYMAIGVNLYNEKKYADAAAAFEKAVAADSTNHDALYNLANAYLALKDGPKLLGAAGRLVALEPLNENALKLQGEGYKESKKVDLAVKTAEQVLALPIALQADEFVRSANGATLTLTATGRQAQTPAGKPIAPAPQRLVFEFLDAKGGVVATQETQIPPLKAGASQQVKLQAQGKGITGWRYSSH